MMTCIISGACACHYWRNLHEQKTCCCRLIPCANVDSLLSATCREALTSSDGALRDFTVLLWLDDLAPSNKKETLAMDSTHIQHEW